MSDLQCPVTVLLVASAAVPPEALAEELSHARVSSVYGGPQEASYVERCATALGCPGAVEPALDGGHIRPALDDIADVHRGETVVVVASSEALRPFAGTGPATTTLRLIGDADGWR